MGAINYGYIEVDLDVLEYAIIEIENYIALLKDKMTVAQCEVDKLLQLCQGTDLAQFKLKWNSACGEDSTYAKCVSALESYAEFLKFAKSQYKTVQEKAINNANSIW